MSIAEFRVSDRGQMALPAECRRRLLCEAIQEAGGYPELANQVAAEDPDLA